MNSYLERDLYAPMAAWLESYLASKYPSYEIIVSDTSGIRLEYALSNYGIVNDEAIDIGIQIDVLGIARRDDDVKLFFIEAKKGPLTLKDLGQLWAYVKLINPEESFLFSPVGLGSLEKILKVHRRLDLLDYSNVNFNRSMVVGKWDIVRGIPVDNTLIPGF